MRIKLLALFLLMALGISGCATDQGGVGSYESETPSSHQGHHH